MDIFKIKGSRYKASLTVEGCLVLPIFLFFMITVMSMLVMTRQQSEEYQDMHQEALKKYGASVCSLPGSIIEVKRDYIQHPVTDYFPFIKVKVSDEIYMHSFTGYTGSGSLGIYGDPDEYVYITRSGTKYHRSPVCTHINIKPHAVNAQDIQNAGNRYGRKYKACSVCHPSISGILFVTDDGECYHCDSGCPALKRTVYMISLKEAIENGYSACSKCG